MKQHKQLKKVWFKLRTVIKQCSGRKQWKYQRWFFLNWRVREATTNKTIKFMSVKRSNWHRKITIAYLKTKRNALRTHRRERQRNENQINHCHWLNENFKFSTNDRTYALKPNKMHQSIFFMSTKTHLLLTCIGRHYNIQMRR